MYHPMYAVQPIKIALNIVPSCWQRAIEVKHFFLSWDFLEAIQ